MRASLFVFWNNNLLFLIRLCLLFTVMITRTQLYFVHRWMQFNWIGQEIDIIIMYYGSLNKRPTKKSSLSINYIASRYPFYGKMVVICIVMAHFPSKGMQQSFHWTNFNWKFHSEFLTNGKLFKKKQPRWWKSFSKRELCRLSMQIDSLTISLILLSNNDTNDIWIIR